MDESDTSREMRCRDDPIDDATTIARSPSAPAVPVDDGLVVMSIERGSYVGLDDIGADIWARIERPCTFRELVDGLATDYDAPRETIAAGVKAWLVRMAKEETVVLG